MLTSSRDDLGTVEGQRNTINLGDLHFDEIGRLLELSDRLLEAAPSLPEGLAADVQELVTLIHRRVHRVVDALGDPPLPGVPCSPREAGGSLPPEVRAAAA